MKSHVSVEKMVRFLTQMQESRHDTLMTTALKTINSFHKAKKQTQTHTQQLSRQYAGTVRHLLFTLTHSNTLHTYRSMLCYSLINTVFNITNIIIIKCVCSVCFVKL